MKQGHIDWTGELFLCRDWMVLSEVSFLREVSGNLGCLSHFVRRGRQSCPQGVILFHTERLTSFKHTIVSSNPTVLPCCNAIHSVAASISVSLSLTCFLTFCSFSVACMLLHGPPTGCSLHNDWEGDIQERWDKTKTSVQRGSLWLCLVPRWNNKSSS